MTFQSFNRREEKIKWTFFHRWRFFHIIMIFIKIFFNHTDVWRLDLFIEEKKPWLVRWYYSQLVIVSSLLLLLTCTHSDVCIYIYINIFSFVGEWFAECCCINVDKCSGYSCRTTQHLINKAWITTILLNLYYYIILFYYIILHIFGEGLVREAHGRGGSSIQGLFFSSDLHFLSRLCCGQG